MSNIFYAQLQTKPMGKVEDKNKYSLHPKMIVCVSNFGEIKAVDHWLSNCK